MSNLAKPKQPPRPILVGDTFRHMATGREARVSAINGDRYTMQVVRSMLRQAPSSTVSEKTLRTAWARFTLPAEQR